MINILNLVKQHHEYKNLFERCFLRLVHGSGYIVSVDVLEFCMHELRWETIRDEVRHLVITTKDMRVRDAIWSIQEAYEDDWDGHLFYKYYQKHK